MSELDDLMPSTAKPLAEASTRIRKAARPAKQPKGWVTFEQWIKPLKWLDGRKLAETIEPYRQDLFTRALDSFDADRRVKFTMILSSRGKKNWKSSDLVLSALHALLANDSPGGNQCYLVANDLGQANDDLTIAKLLLKKNPVIGDLVTIRKNIIERKDETGFLEVLPKNDAQGAHGKTYKWLGFDEVHEYRDYAILEALALDPTRKDSQVHITSYASLFHAPGVPLHDLFETGKAGTDPRMLMSWYAADYCTDPAMADLSPEQRANPSMGTTFDPSYLESQRRRLPSVRFNRLHLNLPGLPEGSAFSLEKIDASIDKGVTVRPPERYITYRAACDMSGGSSDSAVLAIGHEDPERKGYVIIDLVMDQGRPAPFDPNQPIKKWAPILDQYRIKTVFGDSYGGEVFAAQYREHGFTYHKQKDVSASDLYEAFEVPLNAGKVRLPDIPVLQQQFLGLAYRGARVDHAPNQHDDWSNAVAAVTYAILNANKHFTVGAWSIGKNTDGRVYYKDGTAPREALHDETSLRDRGIPAEMVHPHERVERFNVDPMSDRKAAAWRRANKPRLTPVR